ncbi:MAG: hypothetical protein FWC42_07670 [Proteobacteria bacterium]|nr:hypothetical protein [Pseudomonadota bacterium]
MKHRVKFDAVIRFLREQRDAVVEKLRTAEANSELLETKRQLDHAIKCLAFCERYQIHPDSETTTLPWPREAFGEFLVVDVDEMGNESSWTPVLANGEAVTLRPGDLIIRLRHGFNLPPDACA